MRRTRAILAFVTLAAVSLAPGFSHAQVTQPVITFDAVTAYNALLYAGANTLRVTGVQHGASAPSTVFFYFSPSANPSAPQIALAQACEKQLLVAINRPGRFSVSVAYTGTAPPATGSGNANFGSNGCTLTQLP